ncbi:MAG TPA: ferritin-like domain-containing protein [Flavobacteriaceae bacterium]|nr:ferritin-like domain-containing protein [Flavobacteriaceae bacterium]
MKNKKESLGIEKANLFAQETSRRKFLQYSGLAVVGGSLVLAGCSDDDDNSGPPDTEIFDLGSGNLGILNYAYALEQLEAAFYKQVVNGSYWQNADAEEKQILEDLYEHETIHRDFFKTAISAAVSSELMLPELEFDFSSVNFGDRDSVLQTSVILEDTGVAAYNGAGSLIDASDATGAVYLTLAGKIVSVEARHASAVRNLLNPGSINFASPDVLVNLAGSGKAYDKAIAPAGILSAVKATGFITTEFTANNLPTS